ncbi:MAG: DUF2141 domain-containing protein [Thermosynechococcaceae cyanobacterium]
MVSVRNVAVVGGLMAIIGAGVMVPSALASYSSSLEVKLNGLKSANGQVCLTVFSGPKGFPAGGQGSNLMASRCIALGKGGSQVTFENLPLGIYAIAVIHDSNSDGRLNTNPLGIPSEGFGFSNNPPLRFGPAKFGDAQVFVSGTKTLVQIQMRYLN